MAAASRWGCLLRSGHTRYHQWAFVYVSIETTSIPIANQSLNRGILRYMSNHESPMAWSTGQRLESVATDSSRWPDPIGKTEKAEIDRSITIQAIPIVKVNDPIASKSPTSIFTRRSCRLDLALAVEVTDVLLATRFLRSKSLTLEDGVCLSC